MSDVEQRIANWRAELAQSQALGAGDMDELENHLREEIAHLQATDLSEAEAFLVARHRLGDAGRLATEFRKVNGDWRLLEHLSWMALGMLAYLLVGRVATGLSQGSILVATLLGARGPLLGAVALASKAMSFTGLVALMWILLSTWSRSRPTELPHRRPVFVLLTVAGITLVLAAGQLLSALATARMLGIDEIGRIAYISNFGNLAWSLSGPLILAGAAIGFRAYARRHRDVCVAGPSE